MYWNSEMHLNSEKMYLYSSKVYNFWNSDIDLLIFRQIFSDSKFTFELNTIQKYWMDKHNNFFLQFILYHILQQKIKPVMGFQVRYSPRLFIFRCIGLASGKIYLWEKAINQQNLFNPYGIFIKLNTSLKRMSI